VNAAPDERRNAFAERRCGWPASSTRGSTPAWRPRPWSFPGVAGAPPASPEPFDLDALADFAPASLGYARRQERLREPTASPSPRTRTCRTPAHMPPPLRYINVQVDPDHAAAGPGRGYSAARHDQVAMGSFLMGQVGHHYSALSTAITWPSSPWSGPRAWS
jgi:hypothetical protein